MDIFFYQVFFSLSPFLVKNISSKYPSFSNYLSLPSGFLIIFRVHFFSETITMIFLYIYITVFTIYFIILAAASMKSSKKIRDKYTPKDSNICVVIYATGNADTLENLIKQLKNQTYPKQNYTIYTILDKCENISEVTLQSDLNVNVININNMEPVGKSQAYSIIAEKLHEVRDLDAYIFLDSTNYVDSDFLANANYYLTKYDVFNPMVNYFPVQEKLTFWENVKSSYSRYCSRFIYSTRTRLGLTNIINTNSFVIKNLVVQIFFTKIQCI